MGRAIKVIVRSGDLTWEEEHDVPEDVDVRKHIESVIKSFNIARGYNYKLERIIRTRKKQIRQRHTWEKVSLVTEKGGYDKVKCKYCGQPARRFFPDRYVIEGRKKADLIYCKP